MVHVKLAPPTLGTWSMAGLLGIGWPLEYHSHLTKILYLSVYSLPKIGLMYIVSNLLVISLRPSLCAVFNSQTRFDQAKYVQEICKHAAQLQKLQKSNSIELEQLRNELESAHEEKCLQLKQQLEEQSKEANKALQEKEKQLVYLRQLRGDHHTEEETEEKMKECRQQSLEDAQTQLPQQSEPVEVDVTPWKVSRSDVEVVSEIEVGAWGIMAKGVYCGQLVAVKLPHLIILNSHTLEQLEKETQVMTQIRHPNLLRIVAAVFDSESHAFQASPMIITELLDMNLRQCYQQGKLLDSIRLPIFKDVAYGLHHLHDRPNPIIHGNVSPPHVLLEALPAGLWKAKLSDFGSANLASLVKTADEEDHTYLAPEVLPQTDPNIPPIPHTTKSDVFSYGVLMCEVMNAHPPGPKNYVDMVRDQSVPLHGLIVSCTDQNPDNRPTVEEVINELYTIPQPHFHYLKHNVRCACLCMYLCVVCVWLCVFVCCLSVC